MDSLTQFALGAAVGEVVLGRKVGRKAMLWGGLAGTIPDLDVLANPFLTAMEALRFHRGMTHSLFFAFVAAPLLGWLVSRIYRNRAGPEADWRGWTHLFFWALWTHPMLDLFTNYGTQLFWPLTDFPAALSSVFIIDPLYTVPLLVALVYAAFKKRSPEKRLRAVTIALVVSTLYLGWGLVAQRIATSVFRENLSEQGITPARMRVQASPLNTILWNGIAEVQGGFLVGSYGLLDRNREIRFQRIPKNASLLEGVRGTEAVETLEWFSRGFYTVRRRRDGLHVYDLRFGRTDLWLSQGDHPYLFDFRLYQGRGGRLHFELSRPAFGEPGKTLGRFLRRVLGDETVTVERSDSSRVVFTRTSPHRP